ncbi:LamG domain-containing protein, partial [candidate division WWE3 bacterium]|nr:LamG domain-containing protein [candidate division WWE3 bacterium]
LDFDGSDDLINVGSNTVIDDIFDGGGTITAWINPRSFGENGWGRIVDKSSSTGANDGFAFELDDTDNALLYEYGFSSSNGYWRTPTNSISTDEWQHVAVVYNNSSTSNDPILYINGIAMSIPEEFTPAGTRETDASQTMYLGNYSATSRTFDGIIDDIKVYNYARTSSQIIEDMNGGHPIGGSPIGSQIANWHFDEMYGDTVHDTVNGFDADLGGSGQSCPATGTVPCPDWSNTGRVNGALDFDGTDDTLEVADNDAFSFGDTSTDDPFSISAWVYIDDATYFNIVNKISSTTDTNWEWALYMDVDGNLDFDVYDLNNSNGMYAYKNDAMTPYEGSWVHIVATYDGSGDATGLNLYVNGRLEENIDQGTWGSYTAMHNTTSVVEIGSWQADRGGGYEGYANGKIDELKIYATELTPSEVLVDMNANAAADFGATTDEKDNIVDGAGNPPVAYWDFNENTGTTANDKSGNGLTGTLNDFPADPWVLGPNKFGSLGTALTFDATNDDVSVGTSSVIDLADDMTISAWIYPTGWGEGDYGSILSRYNGGDVDDGYTFYLTDAGGADVSQGICIYNGVDNACSDDSVLALNEWQHVVVSIDTDVATFYVNGRAVGGGAFNLALEGTTTAYIGSTDGNNDTFEGAIDNMKVFDYGLSQAQVAYDYNRGAPIGWWRFDECSGATANDASGNGNNGTITPATGNAVGTCGGTAGDMWADGETGKFNASLAFDGTDDYVNIANNDLWDGLTFSISVWIKRDGAQESFANIISRHHASGPYCAPFCLEFDDTDDDDLRLTVGLTDTTPNVTSTTGNVISDGVWHHVVATHDNVTRAINIYVDGELRANSVRAVTSVFTNDNPLRIGSWDGTTEFFKGNIDDVRLYNYVLSEDQIKNIMNNGSAAYFGPAEGSP